MQITRRAAIGSAAATAVSLAARRSHAAGGPVIKIGVLNDQSGPYRDTTGLTSVAASRLAAKEMANHGFDIEVVSADHQNKPDVGASIARAWIDNDGVDVVADVPTSSVALAVAQVCREKDRVHLNASATAVALTGEQCSPNTIVWSFDTYMLGKSTGGAMVKAGGNKWFFITADYAFGHSLEDQTTRFVKAAGGTVVGSVAYPFPTTTDFSSFITQAVTSGANVLGLANAGGDTANCVKQAHEFGLREHGMHVAPLLMFITDVHAVGLDICQGLRMTESFYWDLNPGTRAFTTRLRDSGVTQMPNQAHASSYSSTLHYLKTVAAMGPAEAKKSGAATVARMKAMPTEDDAFGKGSIREDGRGVFPAYLFEVKTPAESKAPWDCYKLIATTPAAEAVRPLGETGCKMVHA
ncbi:MAG TPA: ABC transporter substrate-binding protein [Acidisphaera sp.]|nr:ABC transporter substrate-binding protein [Acidisphaera sp.]